MFWLTLVIDQLAEKKKPKKESLFDGRRTQVTPFHSSFYVTSVLEYRNHCRQIEDVCRGWEIDLIKSHLSSLEIAKLVTDLDPEKLTVDVTSTLLPLAPTPDDIKIIRVSENKIGFSNVIRAMMVKRRI